MRHRKANYKKPFHQISIHAPLAGCDRVPSPSIPFQRISIHAPLAGCDGIGVTSLFTGILFQSTHPLRGATIGVTSLFTGILFQSTHPLRGATCYYCWLCNCSYISIHAPLAGCDSKITEIFTANLRKSYKISAKPNKERRCRVLGKGKAAAISDLARCEPPGENRNASGSHQTISAPSGS